MSGTQSIWRNRDVNLLVAGTTVNEIGDWLLELALPLYVFIETGSGISTAAVYLVRLAVGFLFGAVGGKYADTWRLKSTLVVTNLLQVAALAPLPFVTSDRIWPIFLVVVLQGLISSVNNPASFALLPRLVEGDQLVAANSGLSAGASIARLVGAAAGGVAVELGGMTWVAVIDAGTFLFGAGTAALLSSRADQRPETAEAEDRDSSIRTGIDELRTRPAMAAVVWIQSLAMFVFGGFPVLFIVFVTEYLDGSGTDVGILRASSALSGLLAAAVIGSFARDLAPSRLMTGGYLLFAAIAFLFVNAPPITTAIWAYLLLYGATGFPNVAAGVGGQSTAQQLCPPDVLGRVGGLMSASGSLAMGLGSIAAGLLLEVSTARVLLNGQASIFAICALIGFLFVVRRETPNRAATSQPTAHA